MKLGYSSSVLRYVHDPVTQKFINIGVAVFAPVRTRYPADLPDLTSNEATQAVDLAQQAKHAALKCLPRSFGATRNLILNGITTAWFLVGRKVRSTRSSREFATEQHAYLN